MSMPHCVSSAARDIEHGREGGHCTLQKRPHNLVTPNAVAYIATSQKGMACTPRDPKCGRFFFIFLDFGQISPPAIFGQPWPANGGGGGGVQPTQPRLGTPPLYHISTLYADHASVNTGLTPLLNEARKMAWEHDLQENFLQGGSQDTFPKFKDLQIKGCDDHIMASVYSAFNGVLLDWAKERYPSFSHAKKRGGFVSLPFHLIKHISKRLLGFLASAWRGGREEHKRTHGRVHIHLKGSHHLGTTTGQNY